MLRKGGDAEKESRIKVSCVWGKFNELALGFLGDKGN